MDIASQGLKISSRILSMVEAPIELINQQRSRMESAGERIFNLGQATPGFTPPRVALEATIQALSEPTSHTYTPDPGLPELREAIAELLRTRFTASVHAEEIVVTAGANHAFMLVCSLLIEPGDRVGLLSPYFINHKMAVEGCGGTAIEICPDGEAFSYSAETVERAIVSYQLRALVVVNPSNPTGKVFTREELAVFVGLCQKHGAWLISDEVYSSFVYEPAAMCSLIGFPGAAGCSFTIGSFSKEFGMTGWRLGWLRSPQAYVTQILKVQDYSIICAPRPAQLLALAVLKAAPDWAQRHLPEFATRRRELVSQLEHSGLFRIFASHAAYFIWLRPRMEVDSEREAIDIMRWARVCVIPGRLFGGAWKGWFRISYGSQELRNLREAGQRFVNYFLRARPPLPPEDGERS